MEFATLSTGKTILLSKELWNVESDGTFGCRGTELSIDRFARVPGYDLIVCSLSQFTIKNAPLRIGLFTLPDLHLVSTMEFSILSEGRVRYICSDSTSEHGKGRVLIATIYSLILVEVIAGGQIEIKSILEMSACEALETLEGEKECYSGLASDISLYHDPSGNPVALVSAVAGRVIFLYMNGPQCVPCSLWSHVAVGIPANEENITIDSALKSCREDVEKVTPAVLVITVPGSVRPLRILHAHRGRDGCDSQSDARVYDSRIWHPSTRRGKVLVTVGSDGFVSMSHLDDGDTFSYDCLPYKTFKASPKSPLHYLAIHGDVAFTASSYEMKEKFWDLSKEKTEMKLCVTEELCKTMYYCKFRLMNAEFSDHGVLAVTNSNDRDDTVMNFIIPTGP